MSVWHRAFGWLREDARWVPLGVMALAAVFRLFHLGAESLWNDELATVMFTRDGPIEAVRAAASDTSPPLYYLVQSLLSAVLGTTEWTLRILSASAGIASAGLTYLLGTRLFSRSVGVIAGLAFAVGSMPLRFGQEARAYSLAVLFTLLAAWALLEIVRAPRTSAYAGFALAAAAAAYTHLFGGIAVAGLVVGVLLRPTVVRRAGWRLAVASGAAVLAWLPWAGVLAEQTRRVAAAEQAGGWVLSPPADVFATLHETLVAYVPWGWTNAIVASAFIGLLLYGAFTVDAVRPAAGPEAGTLAGADRLALLAGWIGLVYGGGIAISALVVPIFNARMAIVAAPALLILAANGSLKLWRPAAVALAVAVTLYAASGLVHHYTTPQKDQWREATQHLMANDADDIVAYTAFTLNNVSTYARLLGDADGVAGTGLSRDLGASELRGQLDTALGRRREVWVVQGHVERDPDGMTLLDDVFETKGWHATERVEFRGVSVARYRDESE